MKLLNNNITKDQSRDTGMAMVLLALLVFLALRRNGWVLFAIVLQVVTMTVPTVYRPVAVVWLGLSNLLGLIVSKILMSAVFFGVVTPIGLIRRFAGKDSLKLRAFKMSPESVMLERNHKFTAADIERPY